MTLALYGGQPIRQTMLGYGHQWIDQQDIDAVTEVLRSDFLTCGPKVTELEQALCAQTAANYAVSVSNGTAALHVSCLAAGIGPGDEVIVSPITFAASANCVRYCGGTPVFADIDPQTWNISPDSIEQCITKKTKAIVAVDFMGQPVDGVRIREICDKHGLIFIEDAAHSLGSTLHGKPVGSIADLTTFSFHPVKTVTCGEGGAITTNDPELYQKLNLYSKHGITRDHNLLQEKDVGGWYYEQQCLGYNYRLSDIQAALCLSQLGKLKSFGQRRKELVQFYNQAFKGLSDLIHLPTELEGVDTVRHLYMIRLKLEQLTVGRRTIFDALRAENIGVNVHYIPVYWMPDYQSQGYQKGLCPNAEAYYEGAITLPLHCCMNDTDAQDVVNAVYKVLNAFKKGK